MTRQQLTTLALSLTLAFVLLGGANASPDPDAVLDDFHKAAAEADEDRYFSHLAPEGVFLGTDATERWPKTAFREFAHPHFDAGKGWTFVPRDRHVILSEDGQIAWFDELLDSESYGECRGTGVLQLYDGEWKIEQYHLTIPVPNEIAKEVVGRIREVGGQATEKDRDQR